MPGLFDLMGNLGTDDPQKAAYLALASGLLAGKGNFGQVAGQAVMGSQEAFQNAKKMQQQAEMQRLQMEKLQREAAAQQRAQEFEDQFRAKIVSPQMAAGQAALAGGGGPTTANAAKQAPVDPTQQMMFDAMQLRQMSPIDYLKLQQKDNTPVKLAEGEQLLRPDGKGGYAPVATGKQKSTDDMREFLFAVSRGEVPANVGFTEWMRANKKAGAASVSVNTGQKGYENESKLRNDFKSEPIYKDYQDMVTAHKQIKVGISQANPVGDLAAATKIMKLLDPTSVVRESELAMAMAAAGKIDRLQHFVEIQIKGQKLTPTQRKEFGALADELMAAAGDAYNKKRAEYEKMGKRYELDPSVLGAPYNSADPLGLR